MRQKPPDDISSSSTEPTRPDATSGPVRGAEHGDGLRIMKVGSVVDFAGLIWPAIRREAGRIAATGAMSLAINVLHLAAPAYALFVLSYLAGPGNVPILAVATLVVIAALSMQFLLVETRRRLLQALADRLELRLSERSHVPYDRPARGHAADDIEAVIDLFGGRAGVVLFDLPWIVLFVAAAFWLDTAVGLFVLCATIAGFVAIAVYLLRTIRTGRLPGVAAVLDDARGEGASGPVPAAVPGERQRRAHGTVVGQIVSAAKLVTALAAVGAFALSMWLETGEVTAAGVAIAAALLTSRTAAILRSLAVVAPDVLDAADAARRIAGALAAVTGPAWGLALIPPRLALRIDDLTAEAPGPGGASLSMHLRLRAGEALAIVGPSGSGKTLLWSCLAGLRPPRRGRILLDGVPYERWGRHLRRHVGLLPQDAGQETGTIAQIISGFAPDADMDGVVEAARAIGIDAAIAALPDGYATVMGEGAGALCAGLRQRIALARALHGSPFLVLLDDPLARLDADGIAALDRAIRRVRARGGIVISFHQSHPALAAIDRHAMISDDRVRVVDQRLLPRGTDLARQPPVDGRDVMRWGRAAGLSG